MSLVILLLLVIGYLTSNDYYQNLVLISKSNRYVSNYVILDEDQTFFITIVYMMFASIFISVALMQKSNKEKVLEYQYDNTLQGLFNTLHVIFYSRVIFPISIMWTEGYISTSKATNDLTFNQLFGKYTKETWFEYACFYVFSGFVFAPWLAFDGISKASFFPFWAAIILCAYIHTRILFEVTMLFVLTRKNISKDL